MPDTRTTQGLKGIRRIKDNIAIITLAAALIAGGVAYGTLTTNVDSNKESIKRIERIEANLATKEDLQREIQGVKREIQQTSLTLSAQITALASDISVRVPPFPIAKYESLHRTWQRTTPAFLVRPAPGETRVARDALEILSEDPERRVQAVFDAKVEVCDRHNNTLQIAYLRNPDWTATYKNLKIAESIKKDDPVSTGQVIGNVVDRAPLHFTLKVEEYPLDALLYLPLQKQRKPKLGRE